MRTAVLALALTVFAALSGCSRSTERQTKMYQVGEKASVDQLTYNVIDTQILPRLEDDAAAPRIPENRFYVVQVAVFNAGSNEASIPPMALVDDTGKEYNELPDGSGLPRWLGVIRKVGPGQTEQGEVLFDAPAKHFRLRLTEDTEPTAVLVDIPLNFVHEQLKGVVIPEPVQAPALNTPGSAGQPGRSPQPARSK